MAVLGVGGKIRLKREAPEPIVVRPSSVQTSSNSIYVRDPSFWSGDEVLLACANGIPFDSATDGPDCPNGYAAYFGGPWTIGPNRDHIASDSSPFYDSDGDPFYVNQSSCGLTTTITYFVHRDQLNGLSFYTNKADSLNGFSNNRVPIYAVDFNGLIISALATLDYNTAIELCSEEIKDYSFSQDQSEVKLASICNSAPSSRYFINAGLEGALWVVQADASQWSLNLSAPEVDTTSVGERFGDSVKSIVTGGGSIDFFVERKDLGAEKTDGTMLMQLLLMTEKGCKADAEFWMIDNREIDNELLPGDLYYSTQLLATSIAINTRVDEVIAGSLNFVTVGEIALRMSPIELPVIPPGYG
jgi:hypothetical protein